ncbi:hypothetical protein AB0I82_03895 [Streptomyces sp. NPDC050315]|uniref:hypothetical protein n=1 Tax=Streptomyces sp. NPDC050315 TaxID=3155039 RepID=UPI00343DC0B0
MSEQVPVPWAESRPLPAYRALLAVDAKDFTGLPALLHAPVSQVIPELVDQALTKAGLDSVRSDKSFPASTGDGIVFGFDPVHLPFVISPFLKVLDDVLGRYNVLAAGPRIRLRASVHVGPLPDADSAGDGNGTARNDTHRLLDSRPVKAILAASSEQTTHLAAILSDRVYEDVVLGGYTALHPDRCIEVPATVEGKPFAQRAWLHVPSPSGNLFRAGVLAVDEPHEAGVPDEPSPDPAATRDSLQKSQYQGNSQHVREGMAVMGDITGDLNYNGGATHYNGTNQHWGSGDNVSGTKHTGSPEEQR